MDGEDASNHKGKENKRPNSPEMNPKDEINASAMNHNETNEEKMKEGGHSLPLLPGTPDSNAKYTQSDGRKRSPVRFPALLIPTPDKASRPRSTVAGILFLPSIL
ncbi:uncharacterized protein LOC129961629 isoform X2 [Argiope bruennichi]|nr:uncharacterized protein LOC129961629 isoform X2 [Argiope bruennichi]XP_055931141.1 uncharacterized protein LOC129961629 isoform X2 [Argiope bruennichi]XP_055931148.1 uncharacterized protein LOC129961629 isoform X2 [Argiope bruennichi]